MSELRFGPGVCEKCGVNHDVRTCAEYRRSFGTMAFGLTGEQLRAMQHAMNCPATRPMHEGDCTCGLKWREEIAVYRDIFNEITAKAVPFLNDGDRILSYVIPCGPIHRAAGKVLHQMFDGEAHLRAAVSRIAELEAELVATRKSAKGEI